MIQTPNYALNLPEYNNVADIEVVNENFQKLDTELHKKAGVTELAKKVDKIEGHSLISTAEKETIARLDQKEEVWGSKIDQLEQRADIQWSLIQGADYVQEKTSDGIWLTTATKNGVKIAERIEHPKNAQGKYITIVKIYSASGAVAAQSTITEWKNEQTGKYHEEVR